MNTIKSMTQLVASTRATLTAISVCVALTGLTSMTAAAESVEAESTKTGEQQMVDSAEGNLVIYRTKGLSANSLIYYRVYVDGEMVGQLKRNTVFHVNLSAGEHVVETNDPEQSSLTIMVSQNNTSYVNASIDKSWDVSMESIQPTPTLAARLDNCVSGETSSCVLAESARTNSRRLVSR